MLDKQSPKSGALKQMDDEELGCATLLRGFVFRINPVWRFKSIACVKAGPDVSSIYPRDSS